MYYVKVFACQFPKACRELRRPKVDSKNYNFILIDNFAYDTGFRNAVMIQGLQTVIRLIQGDRKQEAAARLGIEKRRKTVMGHLAAEYGS
jgi:hypothetical protein